MSELKSILSTIEQLFKSCDNDYKLLQNQKIDIDWFDTYENQRIINSFLFNYIKIQDKIGAKLFRNLLFSMKEINDPNLSMIDILHILEKLDIISNIDQWDKLREIRNIIAHEYPTDISERVENIQLALNGYKTMKLLFQNIKDYVALRLNY